jgi:hypothetical protein
MTTTYSTSSACSIANGGKVCTQLQRADPTYSSWTKCLACGTNQTRTLQLTPQNTYVWAYVATTAAPAAQIVEHLELSTELASAATTFDITKWDPATRIYTNPDGSQYMVEGDIDISNITETQQCPVCNGPIEDSIFNKIKIVMVVEYGGLALWIWIIGIIVIIGIITALLFSKDEESK